MIDFVVVKLRDKDETEPAGDEPAVGIVGVPIRHPADPRAAVPTTATKHAARA